MVPNLSSQLTGILFLIISGAILSFTDGLAKFLTGTLVIGEIVFFRAWLEMHAIARLDYLIN